MSREMSKQQIAYIKARYTPGARIELTQDMVGENIRAGTRGTVTGVDDIGSIMMHWDNGRSLSVNMIRLVDFAEGSGNKPIVRFDPSVNRALTYAIAYGLIDRQQTAKYKLTNRGQRLADQIKVAGDLMTVEISSLNLLAKKLTETKVNEIVDMWRAKDAED